MAGLAREDLFEERPEHWAEPTTALQAEGGTRGRGPECPVFEEPGGGMCLQDEGKMAAYSDSLLYILFLSLTQ